MLITGCLPDVIRQRFPTLGSLLQGEFYDQVKTPHYWLVDRWVLPKGAAVAAPLEGCSYGKKTSYYIARDHGYRDSSADQICASLLCLTSRRLMHDACYLMAAIFKPAFGLVTGTPHDPQIKASEGRIFCVHCSVDGEGKMNFTDGQQKQDRPNTGHPLTTNNCCTRVSLALTLNLRPVEKLRISFNAKSQKW